MKEIEEATEKYFVCDVCGFAYKDEATAASCQEWCSEHSSCSIEITKNAVGVLKDGKLKLFNS